jgi:hypothetical protein
MVSKEETNNNYNYYAVFLLIILAVVAGIVGISYMTTGGTPLIQEAYARCFQEWCYAPEDQRNCGSDVCT